MMQLLPVAWALNNLVPVGSSEVNGKGRRWRERDVRVHFARVTDEAPLIRPTVGSPVRSAASADVRG